MLNLASIITGDNLFKYSFTMGVAMYIFAILYPLEKLHNLQIEEVSLKEQASILGYEISKLENAFKNLEKEKKNIEGEYLSKSQLSGKELITYEAVSKRYKAKKDSLDTKLEILQTQNIKLEYSNEKIEVIEKQINDFKTSFILLKWVGSLFACFGLFFWTRQTFWDIPKR